MTFLHDLHASRSPVVWRFALLPHTDYILEGFGVYASTKGDLAAARIGDGDPVRSPYMATPRVRIVVAAAPAWRPRPYFHCRFTTLRNNINDINGEIIRRGACLLATVFCCSMTMNCHITGAWMRTRVRCTTLIGACSRIFPHTPRISPTRRAYNPRRTTRGIRRVRPVCPAR